MYNKSHKINLSGPFGHFVWRYPNHSYLRAWTIETSSLPTDSSRPLLKQIEIFFLVYWLYISTVRTFLYIRSSYWDTSSGFRLLGQIPAPEIITIHSKYFSVSESILILIQQLLSSLSTLAFNTYCSPRNSSRDNLFWDLSWASLWQQNRSITTCSTYRTKYFSQYEQRVGRSKGVVRSKFYRLRKQLSFWFSYKRSTFEWTF